MRKGSNPLPTHIKPKLNLKKKTRFYGDGGTIHSTTHLDVETKNGVVTAVWFRCQTLPFEQTEVDEHRAKSMLNAYKEHSQPEIHGLNLKDV